MNINQKLNELAELKESVMNIKPSGCFSLQDIGESDLDHPIFLTPWTIGACNINAQLMLVAQDWLSQDALKQLDEKDRDILKKIGRNPDLPTNKNIDYFLEYALNIRFESTFATNLFPFIKTGGMSAKIKTSYLNWCAINVLMPQIKIVKPKKIIILGRTVSRAVKKAIQMEGKIMRLSDVSTNEVIDGFEFFYMPHPGGLGTASYGGKEKVRELWKRNLNENANDN